MKKTRVSLQTGIFCQGLFFIVLLLLLAATGCGKMGNPRPAQSQELFDVASFSSSGAGNCLIIQGRISGKASNLESLGLDLAPVDGPEDCPGCPFNSREYVEFSASDIQLDTRSGGFTFSYCPGLSAPSYRWRLVGKNVHHGLPYVLTVPHLQNMHQ